MRLAAAVMTAIALASGANACRPSECARRCDRGPEAQRCMALDGDDARGRCLRACVDACERHGALVSTASSASAPSR